MTESKICTCPSGDGSLRWPCPAHPAVEQAGGDERAAFEVWASALGWKLSPDQNNCGIVVAERYGHPGVQRCWEAWQARAALAQPSPAQAEKAEVERTEGSADLLAIVREAVAGAYNEWKMISEAVTEIMEAHERIVGELRADRDSWAEQAEQRLADWDEMRKERDAALARVADLEKQVAVAWGAFHFGGERDGKLYTHCETEAQIDAYILDMHRSSDSLTLRKSPLYAAPFAQNQPTVPDGYALIPVRETEAMHDAVMALLYKGVARTDTQKLLDAYIAAAPGKEVPQAWLDIQAERRRQVEAEGWTPEHDDLYCAAELPRAAAAYILNGANDEAPAIWPFVAKWWKPRDARSNYVRAGALILAEIERLDRAEPGKEGM